MIQTVIFFFNYWDFFLPLPKKKKIENKFSVKQVFNMKKNIHKNFIPPGYNHCFDISLCIYEYVLYIFKITLYRLFLNFSSVKLLSRVQLFMTLWTTTCKTSLSIINSPSLLKLMSIELVMPSNQLILCRPLLLLPSIFHSIKVFSSESVLCHQVAKVLELYLQP